MARRQNNGDTINLALARDVLGRIQGDLEPPGGCMTFLPHPAFGERKSVSLGVVLQHRFAFFYWLRCKRELRWDRTTRQRVPDRDYDPPDLVTFDRHDDVGGDCDVIESELLRLNQENENELGLFCWAGLRPLDDGHIYPAVWLNAIGNVYAIVKQQKSPWERDYTIADRYGKKHRVRYLRSPAQIVKARQEAATHPGIIWDIDLDFFTKSNGNSDRRSMPVLADRAIARVLDWGQEWVQEVLWNLEAVTIALEPEYTGGLTSSLRLFQQWEKVFFANSVWSDKCRWRRILQ